MRTIPRLHSSEPERNLPGRRRGVMTSEARFTVLFAKAYLDQFQSIHSKTTKTEIICARQVPINGYGIADLVTLAWPLTKHHQRRWSADEFMRLFRPTVRAFEIKMDNWRSGMTQAHRYRYFANTSILVLPTERCKPAIGYIETFKKIRVGLWAYNSKTNKIIAYFTPPRSKPLETRYQAKLINMLARTSRALPILRTK